MLKKYNVSSPDELSDDEKKKFFQEVEMGIKVEMEHTGNELLATRIAHDHLSEIPNYYTLLTAMESKAGIKD